MLIERQYTSILSNPTQKPIRILLLPDQRGWAFDNIASSIIKFNPYPNLLRYTKMFIAERPKIDLNEWDYIYVMFEAERYVPLHKEKVVRGCYSSLWLECCSYSPQYFGELFSQCRAAIFVNDILADAITPFMDNVPWTIVYDSSDESIFYPVPNSKQQDFTAIFVGNTVRAIKRFAAIQEICSQAGIQLLVAQKVPRNELVFEYAKADICINFSVAEGGPQTFAESALCEVPMLIRANNALAQQIPCFQGNTEEDYVAILNYLKNNRHLCLIKGKEARQTVLNNFTYKHVAQKFANFFLMLTQQDQAKG